MAHEHLWMLKAALEEPEKRSFSWPAGGRRITSKPSRTAMSLHWPRDIIEGYELHDNPRAA
jgi:hypothetical protein